MRLRDNLQHANFVAASLAMSDEKLIWAANRARTVQEVIQHMPPWPKEGDNPDHWDDADDWRDHTLALMLLRDCLGREMTRRGLTPPGPPMLARDWESGGMYPLGSGGVVVAMPDWLLERGRRELVAGAVVGYTGSEGVET